MQDYCNPDHDGPIETVQVNPYVQGCTRCGETWGPGTERTEYDDARDWYHQAIDREDWLEAIAYALGVKSGFFNE